MVSFENFFETIGSRSSPHPSQNALDSLYDLIIKEKVATHSGYYHLPFEDRAIKDSQAYIQSRSALLSTIKNLIIIGVGGSSLGTKAIDTMLCHLPHRKNIALKFLEHTDPIEINKALQSVEVTDSLFVIISKSGTTIETSSLMKYVLAHYNLLEHKDHLVVITDENSPLQKWAKSLEVSHICIAPNVGGRFSVLSSVGILPLMILGYDVKALLEGAKKL